MATVTKTVGATGADYTTVQGALDWFVANHNYGTDGIAKVNIIDSGTYTFSSSYDCNIPGTPSATAYLEITSSATDPFSGPIINCTQTTNAALYIWDDYTYIHNLQFQLNNTSTSTECIRVAIDNTTDVLISRCVFIALTQSSQQDGIYAGSISVDLAIDNCVFVGFNRAAIMSQMFQNNGDTQNWHIDHCSFAVDGQDTNEGSAFNIRDRYASNTVNATVYNCLAYDWGGSAANGMFNINVISGGGATINLSGSHNVVDDTSAESKFTSSHDSVTFTETSPASGENAWLTEINTTTETAIDLSIAGENAFTVLDGTDRTGSEPDARQDFSTDILGNARGATPDIGAFEFVSGISGTGALTLAGLTLSGTAERSVTGSGTPTLGAITADGAGTVTGPITGTGALTNPAITASGTAERSVTGSGTPTLPAVTADGAGTVGAVIAGTGALSLPTITLSGTGVREITGTGALTFSILTVDGTSVRELVASGALALPAVTASGTAERAVTGTGALTLPIAQVDGTAALGGVVTGTGALTAPSITLTGVAERSISGSGAATLVSITLSGQALRTWVASGALTLPAAVADGQALRTWVATGAASLPAVTASGVASVPSDITASGALTLPAVRLSGTVIKSGWSDVSPASTLWIDVTDVTTTWTDV